MNKCNKDMMKYELMDGGIRQYTVLEAGYRTAYHYATKGTETFSVIKGRAIAVLNGRRFKLTEGDILNVEAWCPYSLSFPEAGTIIRQMCTGRDNKEYKLPEPAFCEDTDKGKINEVTCDGKGLFEFGAEGIRLVMKVGRWQLGGSKEIWEIHLDKDFRLQCNDDDAGEGLYMVRSGRFMAEAGGKVFSASADDGGLIYIPSNTPYAITALDDGCVIRDFNVSCHLFRLLEMIEAARDYFPEQLGEQEYLDYLISVNKAAKFESLVCSI